VCGKEQRTENDVLTESFVEKRGWWRFFLGYVKDKVGEDARCNIYLLKIEKHIEMIKET
jgi:hypothetical protein